MKFYIFGMEEQAKSSLEIIGHHVVMIWNLWLLRNAVETWGSYSEWSNVANELRYTLVDWLRMIWNLWFLYGFMNAIVLWCGKMNDFLSIRIGQLSFLPILSFTYVLCFGFAGLQGSSLWVDWWMSKLPRDRVCKLLQQKREGDNLQMHTMYGHWICTEGNSTGRHWTDAGFG